MLSPLLTQKPKGFERCSKNIRQLSIGRFESILVIFPLRAILGPREVIKGQTCEYLVSVTAPIPPMRRDQPRTGFKRFIGDFVPIYLMYLTDDDT